MKYGTIKNPNYVATVVRVQALEDLEGLNNLRGLRMFGMQALVSKDVQVGDAGVLFSTEVQLSPDYARYNNLYRHTNENEDPTKTGYLEDNRRVKAIKLRGHRSDSLFMPLASFAYLGVKPEDFTEGDVFDSINGTEVLQKYVIREPRGNNGPVARSRKVDVKNFPVHFDTENYWRNVENIPQSALVTVTQKLHGTSIRIGRATVQRDLSFFERIAARLGVKVQQTESKFVVGSRTVVKSLDGEADSAGHSHYYAADEWTKYVYEHTSLPYNLPDGFLVYGELIGYTSEGAAIQKNYTYEEDSTAKLYVYRVAAITPGGIVVDLTWDQVKRFCQDNGLAWVPELWRGAHHDFDADKWMDKRYYDIYKWVNTVYYPGPESGPPPFVDAPLRLSDKGTVDEGVCIRYEGPNGPYILKAKSPIFLGHESGLLDSGEKDIESEEAR